MELTMTMHSHPLPRRALYTVLAAFALGCADSPTEVPAAAEAGPKVSKPAAVNVAITLADRAGDLITSDLKGTYTHGECGVTASFSGSDIIADILTSAGKGRTLCVGRAVRFSLSSPAESGAPTWGIVSSQVHVKLQGLVNVVAGQPALVDGGFNQLSGVGDCSTLRFNQNWGGDRLLATRTATAGVNGAVRNEWTVETQPGADRAACVDAAGTATLRLYHLPVSLTVVQLN
jgi:hypothetical protein